MGAVGKKCTLINNIELLAQMLAALLGSVIGLEREQLNWARRRRPTP
jgi:hypothetical protein